MFLDKKDKMLKEAEKERDNLILQTEAMGEKLKSNNIEFDAGAFAPKTGGDPNQSFTSASGGAGKPSAGLIEQYKAKLSKA